MDKNMKKLLGIKASKRDDGVVMFRASDEGVDRDGDIVRSSGWELGDWRKNPVFLWAHMASMPPLAQGVEDDLGKDYLDIGVQFAKRGEDYDDWPSVIPSPATVERMYEKQFLRAVSVGFLPTKWNNPESEEERRELGLGRYGYEFVKQSLLEFSAVPVPSNPNALRLAYAADVIDEKQAEVWLKCMMGDSQRYIEESVSTITSQFKTFMSEEHLASVLRKAIEPMLTKEFGSLRAQVAHRGEPETPAPQSKASIADIKALWGNLN